MSRSAQIKSLQAGRALAALSVVVCHASLAAVDSGGIFLGSSMLEYGYLGVDFFFVLSGFIIFHSSQGKTLGNYAAARVGRVYLPYIPIGVGLALLYMIFPQASTHNRDWSWLTTFTLLPLERDTALFVAWTLKHEILFYFIFALLFFSNTLLIGLSFWAVAILWAYFLGVGGIPLALINLEFMFGIAVAFLVTRGVGRAAAVLAAPLPFALWVALGADRSLSVLVGASFALLLLALVRLEREKRFGVPGWLLFLGAASYSIYLAHSIAISIAVRLVSGWHWAAIFGLSLLTGVIGGIAYYFIIERPSLKLWTRSQVVLARFSSTGPELA